MKVEKFVCDLCDADATQQLKFFTIGEKVTRGAPKAKAVYDLCNVCHREITLFLDSLERQAHQ